MTPADGVAERSLGDAGAGPSPSPSCWCRSSRSSTPASPTSRCPTSRGRSPRASTRCRGCSPPTSPPMPSSCPPRGGSPRELGRRRFFLICTVLFTVSSFLSADRAHHRVPDRHARPAGAGRRADHPDRPGRAVGDLPAPPARHGHGGVGARASCSRRRSGRRWAAGSPTTGRGAGSSTSTCPSACSASSWRARSCSTPPHAKPPARVDVLGPPPHGAGLRRACSSCWTGASARTGSTRRRSPRWRWWPSRALAAFVIRELTADGAARRPRRVRRPELHARLGGHGPRGLRLLREHAAAGPLHAEAHGLRRLDVGPRAGAERDRPGVHAR